MGKRAAMSVRFSSFLAALGIVICGFYFYSYKPNHDFWLLLHGDQQVQVTSLRFVGQGKEAIINDAPSLRYITVAWRSALENELCNNGGLIYYVEASLSTGGWVRCAMDVQDGGEAELYFPVDTLLDLREHYRIRLPMPITDHLNQVFSDLQRQTKGTHLINE